MKRNKIKNIFLGKGIFSILVFLPFFFSPSLLLAASELHIGKDGKAVAQGVKVIQAAGMTFFARLYWGDSFVRLTVKTNEKTKLSNLYGESISFRDVKEGDFIDIAGEVEGGTALSFITTSLKDISIQKERSEFSGRVVSLKLSKNTLALETGSRGIIAVTSLSDFLFKKGNLSIPLSKVNVGDKISVVRGSFNHTTKTLTPDFAEISVNLSLFSSQNFEGVIQKINTSFGGETSLTISAGSNTFTVILDSSTSILKASRIKTELSRFEEGDKVRLYGTRQEEDPSTIRNVEIVRNLDL